MTAPEALELVTSFHRYAAACAVRAGRRAGVPWLRDDLESDCLLTLFRAATAFPGDPAGFKPYLAVALKRTINARVRLEREKNPAAFARRPAAGGEELDPLALLADHRPDGREAVDLTDALELLPADVRAALELNAEGFDYERIGAAVGVTGSAVRQRVRAAVGKLRT